MLKKFETQYVLQALTLLESFRAKSAAYIDFFAWQGDRKRWVTFPMTDFKALEDALGNIKTAGIEYGMLGIRDPFDQVCAAVRQCEAAKWELEISQLGLLESSLSHLLIIYRHGLNNLRLFTVSGRYAEFVAAPETSVGENVEGAFPSCVYELQEASKCLALERWTASVMHSMRALEQPLAELARSVGVPAEKDNWWPIIRGINNEIARRKESLGHNALQFESEAVAHFAAIKDAWRNHAAHGKARYNEEEAIAAYDAVRSVIRHLSQRLRERGEG